MDTIPFPLSLDYEGEHYNGTIEPSTEVDEHGVPVHFRVIIDGKLFAYLCCGSKGWGDDGSHPKNLVNAIGQYITEWYE